MIIDNKTTSFVSKASCNRISCYFFFSVNAIKIVQKNVLILTLCKSKPRKKITQKYKSKGQLEKISIWHQVDQRYLYIHRSWNLIQIQGNFSCNSQIIQENFFVFFKMHLRKRNDNILCSNKHTSISPLDLVDVSCFNRNTKYFSPVIPLILYVQYLWPCPAKAILGILFLFRNK